MRLTAYHCVQFARGKLRSIPRPGEDTRGEDTTSTKKNATPIPLERINQSILILRGHKVLLDADLASMYGVATKVLLQAIKRKASRFPEDFMFRLTTAEWSALRSQIVTSSSEHGGRRYAPYAFTEQGVAMLSSVLNSERAVSVNIEIMRAFVRMREMLASNKELARQLKELETRVNRKLDTHDQSIAGILNVIRQLMDPPVGTRRSIGFVPLEEKKR